MLHPELEDIIDHGIPINPTFNHSNSREGVVSMIDVKSLNCDMVKLPEIISDWDAEAKSVYIANLLAEELETIFGSYCLQVGEVQDSHGTVMAILGNRLFKVEDKKELRNTQKVLFRNDVITYQRIKGWARYEDLFATTDGNVYNYTQLPGGSTASFWTKVE